MSINKIYLPELKKLEFDLKEIGSSKFFMRYVRNREAFVGSCDSMDFVDNFCKKYNKNGTTEFTEINQETFLKK